MQVASPACLVLCVLVSWCRPPGASLSTSWGLQEQQGLGVRRADGEWEWRDGDPLADELAKELLDLNARLAENPVRRVAAGAASARATCNSCCKQTWQHASTRGCLAQAEPARPVRASNDVPPGARLNQRMPQTAQCSPAECPNGSNANWDVLNWSSNSRSTCGPRTGRAGARPRSRNVQRR